MAARKSAKSAVEVPKSDTDPATMSIRIPRHVHERLRKLSFERRRPMHDFIMQGIELVLKAEKY